MKFVFAWEQYGSARWWVVRDTNGIVIAEVRKITEGWWWRWLGVEDLRVINLRRNEEKIHSLESGKQIIEKILESLDYKLVSKNLKVMK